MAEKIKVGPSKLNAVIYCQKRDLLVVEGVESGVDLGFSRGGAGFRKFFENVNFFVMVDQIDFQSTPKSLQRSLFDQTYALQSKF